MKIIATAPGRAALAGNPGDVYLENPKVVALTLEKKTIVEIEHAKKNEIKNPIRNHEHRLIEQAIKHFNTPPLKISYYADIPEACGLGGSASILVAFIGAIKKLLNMNLTPIQIAHHSLKVEDELGITAGLQDRWVSTFGSCLMHLSEDDYEEISSEIPNTYVAYYKKQTFETSGSVHDRGKKLADQAFIKTMQKTSSLAQKCFNAIQNQDWKTMGKTMNKNFEIRKQLLGLRKNDDEIRNIVNQNKAYCNQTGSGGAVIVYDPEYAAKPELKKAGCKFLNIKHDKLNI